MPTFWAIPSRAETLPRWNLGTWSEMVAMNGARVAFAPSCARHQPAVTIGTLWPRAITANAAVMTTVPATIHGRRRPHREVVRSDSRPNSTLPITANSAPNPATVASAGAFSGPGTMDWTFTPIPMIAGPSSATKNTNWAITRAQTNFGPTSLVGSLNQWCSCGSTTSRAIAASSVGGRSPNGLPGVLLIETLLECRTLVRHRPVKTHHQRGPSTGTYDPAAAAQRAGRTRPLNRDRGGVLDTVADAHGQRHRPQEPPGPLQR